jgi:hypothetical protein
VNVADVLKFLDKVFEGKDFAELAHAPEGRYILRAHAIRNPSR